jgi:cell division protein FtsL
MNAATIASSQAQKTRAEPNQASRRAETKANDSFLLVWTLAVVAAVLAFSVHLTLRGKTLETGYELGRARVEQNRLRESKRVLELEAASYKNPARVELLSRTLLGMERPAAERIITLPATWAATVEPQSP